MEGRPASDLPAIGDGRDRDAPRPLLAGQGPFPASRPLPPALSSRPTLGALFKALGRRRMPALGLGLVGSAATALAVFLLVPATRYTARSLIQVASAPPQIVFDAQPDSTSGRTDFRTYQKTQLTLVKSQIVLKPALDRPEVKALEAVRGQADPLHWLESELIVDFEGEILRIALTGDDPVALKVLVNAVTEAYLEQVVSLERARRLERHEKLKEIYLKYQEDLKSKRQKVKDLAETVGSNNKDTLTLKHQIAIERHADGDRELMTLQADLRRARAEFAAMQADAATDRGIAVSEAEVAEIVDGDPVVEQYKKRIAQYRTSADANARRVRNPNDPSVLEHRKALAASQRQLNDYRARQSALVRERLRERGRGEGRNDAEQLQRRIAFLEKYEETVKEELGRLAEGTRFLYRKSSDLEAIQDEIRDADGAARQVGAALEALDVELEAPLRAKLVQLADVPRPSGSRKRILAAGTASAGVFLLALLGVSYREFRARRIGSVDEVVHGLGMRIVGALPALPPHARGRAPGLRKGADTQWQGRLAESINATRTRLLHLSRVGPLRVVMVTSAVGGEGKTSLSGHLATSLARAGRRTLLVDFDLRSPSMHQVFDLPRSPGLSEVLRGEVALEDALCATSEADLHVLPAGRCDSDAVQSIALESTRAIFERMKESYDFIVVDTPPVLSVADSLLISQHVDAVLFSILHEVSRIPKVHAAYEQLAVLGARMLGAVVTGMPSEHVPESQYLTLSGR